jgi:hypothetical protein
MLLGPGARYTQRHGRVELQAFAFDRFAATHAIAEFAICYSLQRSLYPDQLDLAAALGFDRHCLRLQGVHTRKSSDARLVEFDRFRRLGARCREGLQLIALLDEPGFKDRVVDATIHFDMTAIRQDVILRQCFAPKLWYGYGRTVDPRHYSNNSSSIAALIRAVARAAAARS